MEFSKLWLDYRKLADNRSRVIISCDNTLKDSAAFEELKIAMASMVPDAIVLWKSEVFDDDSCLIVLTIRPELSEEEYDIAVRCVRIFKKDRTFGKIHQLHLPQKALSANTYAEPLGRG